MGLAASPPVDVHVEPGDDVPPLSAGEQCSVLLSLCDFSEGRIVPDDLGHVSVKHAIIEGDAAT